MARATRGGKDETAFRRELIRLESESRLERQTREDDLRDELTKIRSQGKWGMGNTIAAGLLAVLLAVGTHVADGLNPSSPTTETRSQCASAFANVKDAVDMGIESPDLLENVNPEDVDEECGEETDIADDLAPEPN